MKKNKEKLLNSRFPQFCGKISDGNETNKLRCGASWLCADASLLMTFVVMTSAIMTFVLMKFALMALEQMPLEQMSLEQML